MLKKGKKKPNNYWTKERCSEVAKNFEYIGDFTKQESAAYSAAHKKGFLYEITSHMKFKNNKFKRMIYAFEFPDNHVYIGLTMNKERRFRDHLTENKSAVKQHIDKTSLIPIVKEISNYIPATEAQKLEFDTIEKYKEDNWIILNTAKPGALGGSIIKWDYDKCKKAAEKYPNRSSFAKANHAASNWSIKNGWIDDFFPVKIKSWNYDNIKEAAKECKTRKQFGIKYHRAYEVARINKWLDEFYPKNKTI